MQHILGSNEYYYLVQSEKDARFLSSCNKIKKESIWLDTLNAFKLNTQTLQILFYSFYFLSIQTNTHFVPWCHLNLKHSISHMFQMVQKRKSILKTHFNYCSSLNSSSKFSRIFVLLFFVTFRNNYFLSILKNVLLNLFLVKVFIKTCLKLNYF